MKRWWWIVLLALSLGVNVGILSTLAMRHLQPKPSTEVNPRRALERLVHQLGLEGEERSRFISIQKEFYERTRQNHRARRQAQNRLKRLLSTPSPKRERIDAAIDELADLHGQRHRFLAEAVLSSSELLNRRQLIAYRNFLGRIGGRLHSRGDRWGP